MRLSPLIIIVIALFTAPSFASRQNSNNDVIEAARFSADVFCEDEYYLASETKCRAGARLAEITLRQEPETSYMELLEKCEFKNYCSEAVSRFYISLQGLDDELKPLLEKARGRCIDDYSLGTELFCKKVVEKLVAFTVDFGFSQQMAAICSRVEDEDYERVCNEMRVKLFEMATSPQS